MCFVRNNLKIVSTGYLLNIKYYLSLTYTYPSYIVVSIFLWKDLDPVVNIVSAQETGSILKIGFALSKWLHFHCALWNHLDLKSAKSAQAAKTLAKKQFQST